MRKTDFGPYVLPMPLAMIPALGASPAVGQGPTPLGPQNIGCATPPITLVASGYTLSPSPAGYGSVNGVFLFSLPFPSPVQIYTLPSTASFGSSGGCCNPGPSTIYSYHWYAVSPFEFGTFPYPAGATGEIWVQELIVRPASPFNPCTIYVTNQVKFQL